MRVNAGRAPTPIGNDAILPFVDVPHWFTHRVVRELRRHRIEYALRPAYIQAVGSEDPDAHTDRLVFPEAEPSAIQCLIDAVVPREYR